MPMKVTRVPAKLRPGDRANFQTMLDAHSDGNLALVSAIRKTDGKNIALVCAMSTVPDGSGEIACVPFAVMIEGNPFELFEDPTADVNA